MMLPIKVLTLGLAKPLSLQIRFDIAIVRVGDTDGIGDAFTELWRGNDFGMASVA